MNPTDWFGKPLEVLKSPKLLGMGVLVAGLILWFPRRYLPPDVVTGISKYQIWVFLVFAISVSGLLVHLVAWMWGLVIARYQHRQARHELFDSLKALTPDERYVLLRYVKANTVTQYLEIDNGVVGSLRHKGMLYLGSNVGRFNTVAININGEVLSFLKEHPELLEGSVAPQQTAFEQARPRFR